MTAVLDPELVEALHAAKDRAYKAAIDAPDQQRLNHFFLLYNQERGVFGNRKGNRWRMTRREWIERHVVIVDKKARAIPFTYNQSQRNLEAVLLRQERRGAPRRVVILKVRQNGISTFTLAVFLHALLTVANLNLRVVTDREELCETLLNRVKLMFQRLRMNDGSPWSLNPEKSNRDMIVMGAPFNSRIQVVSANTPNPGFGETNLYVDMEETSKWPDAEEKGKGIELALPELPETLAIDVSQAKGNTGYFADKFRRAWYKQQGLALPDDLKQEDNGGVSDGSGWHAMFIPWFLHEEYRWTKIGSNPPVLPEPVRARIEKTLTPEERILLAQRFHIRGKPPQCVSYDQLAWRRYYISEKCNGNLQTFHEQCPAFPEEALLASGRSAFNLEHVQLKMGTHVRAPLAVAKLVESEGKPHLLHDRHGELSVWRWPAMGRQYVIGVDTAAGVRGGDPCVAQVIDAQTEALVAEWYGWEPPHAFGRTVKLLSDLYNATVAVETHPSQHGLAVYEAAEAAGCQRLFVQQRWEDREGKFVLRKGWIMSAQGKALVIDRVAIALADQNVDTPSKRLLQECMDAQLDEKEKIDRKCRNDAIMAYGIALKLLETVKIQNVKPAEPEKLPPSGSDEDFWRARNQRRGSTDGTPRRFDKGPNGQGL